MAAPYDQFVAALVHGGRDAVKEARMSGISSDHVEGMAERVVYQFLLDYVDKYDGDPDTTIVFGETGIDVGVPPPQPATYWVDKIQEVRLQVRMAAHHGELGDLLNRAAPWEAYKKTQEIVGELQEHGITPAKVVPLWSLIPSAIERYNAVKGGLRGVPFPWDAITEETMGMWPEDLVLFIARAAVGKTWTMILLGLCAWAAGKKVLFATTEMAQATIVQRFLSMHLKLPYRQLRRGMLDMWDEQRFFDEAEQIEEDENLCIIGGDFDFRVETFSAAIEDAKPDLAILDGAYLLKVQAAKGAKRTEQAAEAFNALKRLCKQHKVPIAVTHQFNREGAKNPALENIGLSDVGGWNADLAFALVQSEEDKKEKIMEIVTMKGREVVIPKFRSNWDFEYMDFSEIKPKGGGDAEEPQAGVGDPSATDPSQSSSNMPF